MNIEQVQAMTDQELRIKVAELCGWKITNGYLHNEKMSVYNVGTLITSMWDCLNMILPYLPDYPNDLNAMHDAEATMTREQQRKYTKILHPRHITNLSGDWCILHATARQRAEAFVLTMEIK